MHNTWSPTLTSPLLIQAAYQHYIRLRHTEYDNLLRQLAGKTKKQKLEIMRQDYERMKQRRQAGNVNKENTARGKDDFL